MIYPHPTSGDSIGTYGKQIGLLSGYICPYICLVLVTYDNPYCKFLYEGIFDKYFLKIMCRYSSMDFMKINIYLKHWHQDHRFEDMNMI
jgi:hypothetical protein